MKKFTVQFKEVSYYTVDVKAETEEEALQKANEIWNNDPDDTDFADSVFEGMSIVCAEDETPAEFIMRTVHDTGMISLSKKSGDYITIFDDEKGDVYIKKADGNIAGIWEIPYEDVKKVADDLKDDFD